MSKRSRASVLAMITLSARLAGAAAPQVQFTLPPQDTTPATFGQLPFPCDLYFDGGQPGDGDGTLLATGASIGLGTDVVRPTPSRSRTPST